MEAEKKIDFIDFKEDPAHSLNKKLFKWISGTLFEIRQTQHFNLFGFQKNEKIDGKSVSNFSIFFQLAHPYWIYSDYEYYLLGLKYTMHSHITHFLEFNQYVLLKFNFNDLKNKQFYLKLPYSKTNKIIQEGNYYYEHHLSFKFFFFEEQLKILNIPIKIQLGSLVNFNFGKAWMFSDFQSKMNTTALSKAIISHLYVGVMININAFSLALGLSIPLNQFLLKKNKFDYYISSEAIYSSHSSYLFEETNW